MLVTHICRTMHNSSQQVPTKRPQYFIQVNGKYPLQTNMDFQQRKGHYGHNVLFKYSCKILV